MKIVYTFAEYQAMINSTNAVLPEIIDGFPSVSMEEMLSMSSTDKRVTVDYEKQEISIEVPERFVVNVSNIVVKHSSAIAAVAKAIVGVAKAMKSLFGDIKSDVQKLVDSEIEEAAKEEQKQAA